MQRPAREPVPSHLEDLGGTVSGSSSPTSSGGILHSLLGCDILGVASERREQPDELVQKRPRMAQDQAAVVTASTLDREEDAASVSFRRYRVKRPTVSVADQRFDGTLSSRQSCDGSGDAAPRTDHECLRGCITMNTGATFDKGHVRLQVGQDLFLFQRRVQGAALFG